MTDNFNSNRKTTTNHFTGYLWWGIAIVAALIGIPLMFISGPIGWLGLVIVFLSIKAGIKSRRHRNPDGLELLQKDRRPAIVYLRSFDEDAETETVMGLLWSFIRHEFAQGSIFSKSGFAQSTDIMIHSELAKIMNQIGPYVAVGRPGEELPAIGAARIYLGNDWQVHVEELLKHARFVIMRAGTTEGLNWEVDTIKRLLQPHQLLLILPFDTALSANYQSCRKAMRSVNFNLPAEPPPSGLVMFSKTWEPIPLNHRRTLEQTLEPFLEDSKRF